MFLIKFSQNFIVLFDSENMFDFNMYPYTYHFTYIRVQENYNFWHLYLIGLKFELSLIKIFIECLKYLNFLIEYLLFDFIVKENYTIVIVVV